MAELRWALLLLGVVFIGALAVWELRKRRPQSNPSSAQSGAQGSLAGDGPGGANGREHQALAPSTLAPIADANVGGGRQQPTFSMPDFPAREPLQRIPLVEISDSGVVEEYVVPEAASGSRDGTATLADPVQVATEWLAHGVAAAAPRLVLDWPPEEQRRIVALRVTARSGEKFAGGPLRQALAGEGFQLGERDIFHKPVGDGRVLVSAASLTRPGTFDAEQMDGLFFAGLNLFCVLPGPLSPRDSLDRLVLVARTLAQRLRGEVADHRGAPLTEVRVSELRREIGSETGAVPSAVAAPSAAATGS